MTQFRLIGSPARHAPDTRGSRRAFLAGLGAFGLDGMARSSQAKAEPIRSMLELRRTNIMIQEWDLSCGAAALGTLLRFQHGVDVDERTLVSELIQRDIYLENPEIIRFREGFSLLDLKRVVDARGFTGLGFGSLDFEDALKLAPVITPISPNGYNHFVILIGLTGNTVSVADPAFGNMTYSRRRFERIWLDLPQLGHVGFIVQRGKNPSPPGGLVPDPRVFLLPPPGMLRKTLTP